MTFNVGETHFECVGISLLARAPARWTTSRVLFSAKMLKDKRPRVEDNKAEEEANRQAGMQPATLTYLVVFTVLFFVFRYETSTPKLVKS